MAHHSCFGWCRRYSWVRQVRTHRLISHGFASTWLRIKNLFQDYEKGVDIAITLVSHRRTTFAIFLKPITWPCQWLSSLAPFFFADVGNGAALTMTTRTTWATLGPRWSPLSGCDSRYRSGRCSETHGSGYIISTRICLW